MEYKLNIQRQKWLLLPLRGEVWTLCFKIQGSSIEAANTSSDNALTLDEQTYF